MCRTIRSHSFPISNIHDKLDDDSFFRKKNEQRLQNRKQMTSININKWFFHFSSMRWMLSVFFLSSHTTHLFHSTSRNDYKYSFITWCCRSIVTRRVCPSHGIDHCGAYVIDCSGFYHTRNRHWTCPLLVWYQNCHSHILSVGGMFAAMKQELNGRGLIAKTCRRLFLVLLIFVVNRKVIDAGGCHALFLLIEIHDWLSLPFRLTSAKQERKKTNHENHDDDPEESSNRRWEEKV